MAAKQMMTTGANRAEATRMLQTELRALRRLKHRHVIALYFVVLDDPTYVAMVMQLSTLGTLSGLLQGKRAELKTVPGQRRMLHSVASGMAFLHSSKVQHHDLKPDNVLAFDDGDGKLYGKLSDFGLAVTQHG